MLSCFLNIWVRMKMMCAISFQCLLGSRGSFFIIGPLAIAHPSTLSWPELWEEKKEDEDEDMDKYAKYVRLWHGKGDFQSIFPPVLTIKKNTSS